jgi:S-adenosylmethionine:tRNA ribosyltransferase-isomerase
MIIHNLSSMLVDEFAYGLPPELIAQKPLAERDSSRMLVLTRGSGHWQDRTFAEIPRILQPGDLLVFNNTKVFPARLLGRRRGVKAQPLGKNNPKRHEFLAGKAEFLLTRHEGNDVWQGLVHPGRKVPLGEVLVFGDDELEAEILDRGEYGIRRARLKARAGNVEDAIDRLGHVPLPPYIRRGDEASDRTTYQTVYAKVRGAVAAPTAGLHFTEKILSALASRGVQTCEITLHVGLGTFQPVRTLKVQDHQMEAERFEISEAAARMINCALVERRRIVAVGTTTVRALETVGRERAGRIAPGRGESRLFIYPGFNWQVIGGLLTNFHLPRSTLLMLVAAFAGKDYVLGAYRHAVQARYRFYSYGDCMLIL